MTDITETKYLLDTNVVNKFAENISSGQRLLCSDMNQLFQRGEQTPSIDAAHKLIRTMHCDLQQAGMVLSIVEPLKRLLQVFQTPELATQHYQTLVHQYAVPVDKLPSFLSVHSRFNAPNHDIAELAIKRLANASSPGEYVSQVMALVKRLWDEHSLHGSWVNGLEPGKMERILRRFETHHWTAFSSRLAMKTDMTFTKFCHECKSASQLVALILTDLVSGDLMGDIIEAHGGDPLEAARRLLLVSHHQTYTDLVVYLWKNHKLPSHWIDQMERRSAPIKLIDMIRMIETKLYPRIQTMIPGSSDMERSFTQFCHDCGSVSKMISTVQHFAETLEIETKTALNATNKNQPGVLSRFWNYLSEGSY